jgi:hypothetical protein
MKIHLPLIHPARSPKAGQHYLPIGFTKSGRAIWPAMGGAPDDGDGDVDPDDRGDNDGTGTDTGAGGSGANTEGDAASIAAQLDAVTRRMQAADKRASAAEQKLKEQEDAKKDELTKTTERVAELEKAVQERDSELGKLRLQNAFLTVNDFDWQDPDDALALAERGGYMEGVVGEDGTVDASQLKKKLNELATKKPHLVKAKQGEDNNGGGTPPPSGAPVGSKGKKDKGPSRDMLAAKYPIINR